MPDKFKGSLSAFGAAQAIARGWSRSRPQDSLELLPMSDGGDGFGEVMSALLNARPQRIKTVDAAHCPCNATWWWEARAKIAIVESAQVVGLAMLPPGRFHPFALDTFGLGPVLEAVRRKGAKQILIGIGGSATNDGGFGLARALGWEFRDARGELIEEWTRLHSLREIRPPASRRVGKVVVAVDVENPLLGTRGATRVYGPQKGMRASEFSEAERNLQRLAQVIARSRFGVPASAGRGRLKAELHTIPGAGAAGGLGFGLLAFLGAKPEPGFELFARHAQMMRRLRTADLVITGEGAIDRSTAMGKGVGQIAMRCRELGIPCLGLAGVVLHSRKGGRLFEQVHALTDLTSVAEAKAKPTFWLARLAASAGKEFSRPRKSH